MVSSPCTFLKVIHIFHRVIEILCLRRMRYETNIDNLRALGMLSGGNEYVTEFQFSICHVCLVTMSQVSRVSVTIFHRLWRVGEDQYYGVMETLMDIISRLSLYSRF